jgi:hypothetical protein
MALTPIPTTKVPNCLPQVGARRGQRSFAGLARDKIPLDEGRSRVLRMVVRSQDGDKLLTVTLNYAEEPADWPTGAL